MQALEAAAGKEGAPGLQGNPGPVGPQGIAGPAGSPGRDVDIDAVAAAVVAKLPPIHVVQRDGRTGEVISEGDVPLGKTLELDFWSGEQK